jgi:transcription initiation factor TFIIB
MAYVKMENDISTCPDCSNTNIILDQKHGEMVCNRCGLVIMDMIPDDGPEWRAFDEDQRNKRARAGGPVKYAKLNKGLTTEIDKYDRDIRGNSIPSEQKAKLYRMRKWQKRSRMSDSVQRNLYTALPELDRMCSFLNVPSNIKEECAQLYRKIVNKGLVKGRSIESVVSAVLYLVSRKHHLPKTLEELEEASGVSKKNIGRSYRFVCRKLALKMPVVTSMDYVPRLAIELGISGETEAKAIEILKEATKKGITAGREPMGAAAAAMCLAGVLTRDRKADKNRIIQVKGVTELTLQNRFVELRTKVMGLDAQPA